MWLARKDIAIFTSDNTRLEDPELIIKQMVDGVENGYKNRYVTIIDRMEAIFDFIIGSLYGSKSRGRLCVSAFLNCAKLTRCFT